ncbi:hypothetical protein [Nostoc sp.]
MNNGYADNLSLVITKVPEHTLGVSDILLSKISPTQYGLLKA